MAETKKEEVSPGVFRDVIAELKDDAEIKFLDHGFVRLIDCSPRIVATDSIGVESRIIEAARVSYGGGTKKTSSDLALLSYLYRHGHMTPFEMVELTFMAKVPLFVARQHMRHRTFSYNEESARYSVIANEMYLPMPLDIRAQSSKNKQGSDEKELDVAVGQAFSEAVNSLGMAAFTEYNQAVGKGVAREMARVILPEGRYTKYYFKGNLRNVLHFLKLRTDAHAQKEMRVFAEAVYDLVKKVAPHAVNVFETYTKGAMTLSAHEVAALSKMLRGSHQDETPLDKSLSEREKVEWLEKMHLLLYPLELTTLDKG